MDPTNIAIEPISNAENDNIEVVVTLPTGERYWATFITLENIRSLFEKNTLTGEHAGGTYFPVASNMIIVRHLTRPVVERTVHDLLATGELSSVFSRLVPKEDGEAPG